MSFQYSAFHQESLLFPTIQKQLLSDQTLSSLLQRVEAQTHRSESVPRAFVPYLVALIRSRHPDRRMLLLVPDETQAQTVASDVSSLGFSAAVFPSWGTVPYVPLDLRAPVFSQRAELLADFVAHPRLLIASLRSFLYRVPDPEYSKTALYHLRKDGEIDPTAVAEKLVQWGYQRVPRVSIHGEFSLRGEVLDFFPPAAPHPLRVVFSYDRITEIKRFDVNSQLSSESQDDCVIGAMYEVVWNEQVETQIAQRMCDLSLDLEVLRGETGGIQGREYLFPLLFPDSSLLSYLQPEDLFIAYDHTSLENTHRVFRKELQQGYHSTHVFPAPEKLVTPLDITSAYLHLNPYEEANPRIHACPRFAGNVTLCREKMEELQQQGVDIIIATRNPQQQQRLQHLFPDYSVQLGSISTGFLFPEVGLAVFSEEDILGRRPPPSVGQHQSNPFTSFMDLEEGTLVVHVQHGIGRYQEIKRIRTGTMEQDYIHIRFAQEDSLFVPIEQMNLVQRYIGEENPSLDTLGGSSWKRRKKKVQENIEDMADHLLRLYAERETVRGYAFAADSAWQDMFESSFSYTETEDQLQASAEIKADMERDTPMDRLLCGDVGFGKTEVALRAAFKAVMDGKQVSFLAPTTILVEQHYETIRERMQKFPVHVRMLSRFVPASEQKKILKELAEGRVDILVGTHRILQKDVQFHTLGLIIVDEEQRFGVKAKEFLKEKKMNVDYLMLSATPIPRTLHMALMQIRNMSILRTPPQNRNPIRTIVLRFDTTKVAEAIRKEISRGGQVYFLHNRIDTLPAMKNLIQSLVPEALVTAVHGRMKSRQLEEEMYRFIHGASNVLVSTTIIENGLDIPNVNTIIIDRADHYGVAQLYQLRGRVGRSDRLAYAYLMYPDDSTLSPIALKRLEVIHDCTELGSGFQVAIQDMEIRGVGNLLGRQQSGNVGSVGLELYLQLLQDTMNVKQGLMREEELVLEFIHDSHVPDSYVADTQLKMDIYKDMSSVHSQEDLEQFKAQIEDRYGPIPREMQGLFALSQLRVYCRQLHISSIRERKHRVEVMFHQVPSSIAEKCVALIEQGQIWMDVEKENVLFINLKSVKPSDKPAYLTEILEALQ